MILDFDFRGAYFYLELQNKKYTNKYNSQTEDNYWYSHKISERVSFPLWIIQFRLSSNVTYSLSALKN